MKQLCITEFSICLTPTVDLQATCTEVNHSLTVNLMLGVVAIVGGDHLTPGGSSETIKDLNYTLPKESFIPNPTCPDMDKVVPKLLGYTPLPVVCFSGHILCLELEKN